MLLICNSAELAGSKPTDMVDHHVNVDNHLLRIHATQVRLAPFGRARQLTAAWRTLEGRTHLATVDQVVLHAGHSRKGSKVVLQRVSS